MPLQPEIWQADIVENLYRDNAFLMEATNGDQYVTGGRAVHIPQAGQPSNVVANRASLPATVLKRTDSEVLYALDEYTSDPVLIQNIDDIQLAYDKRASVMMNDQANLNQVAADVMLYRWGGTTTNIVRTSGAAAPTTLTGATGTRKKFTKLDLLAAMNAMDEQNIPAEGRVALLPPSFLNELLIDKDLSVNFVRYADMTTGVVGNLFGFKIIKRSTTLRNAADGTAKSPDSATAADDNKGALCWHPSSVERALGTVKMFEQLNHPQYYGDIYSFLLMLGGRVRRADSKGVVSIVEAN